MTPRVTVEGDIILDLTVDNSSRSSDVPVAGVSVPSFGQRTVTTRLRLRDGESNLLAGLLREDERKSLRGFPGLINVPILSQLFAANDNEVRQTDIVMLLTPHIIRTSEITEQDLRPIHIGSQQNLGIGGPPPLIGGIVEPPAGVAGADPAAAPAPAAGAAPGATVPGTTTGPSPAVPQPNAGPAPSGASPVSPASATPAPITSPGVGLAQVLVSPPAATFRVGSGPYTVPLSITNASRLSTIALTITYDPMILRVRSVQEGSFMRSGGANATFTQQASPGRVDITIMRASDATGASGTGLLGAILFEALAPGTSALTVSGTGTGPGGAAMGLQFQQVTVTVQ
jgi:general secretion pathway protein D